MCTTTEDRVNQVIASKNGLRLDSTWKNIDQKVHVRCDKGHEWWVKAASILYADSWCRQCYIETRRLGIQGARAYAKKYKGRCLSRRYVNTHEPLVWVCEQGHQFERSMHSMKEGRWCPVCPPVDVDPDRKTGMALALEKAAAAGGVLLSNCSRSNERCSWMCKEGHTFRATGKSIGKRDYFCPTCEGRGQVTLEQIQEHCRSLGGRCLSTKYENAHAPMLFECAEGHRWMGRWRNVGWNKSWCRTCARTRGGMVVLQGIASHHQGELLSTTYRGCNKRYKWACRCGHRFSARSFEAKRYWCPKCPPQPPLEKSAHELVAEKWNGEVLDEKNGRWRCDEMHEFNATLAMAASVWCPKCRIQTNQDTVQDVPASVEIPVGRKKSPPEVPLGG